MLLQQSQITIADIFGHRYQLSVSSYGRPSAGSPRHFTDVESATQFLRSLRTSPETWRRLLASIGDPANKCSAPGLIRACADLAARGRIRFYPVPQTNKAHAITAEPGWAYAFASADQSVADSPGQLISVTDAAEAEVLVSRLSPSTSWANILYKAGLQNRISADAPAANRGQVVQALAEQKLIAYKTRHQSGPIAKPTGESAPAAGPGVRPVPLAPESGSKAESSTKPPSLSSRKGVPPESLEDAVNRLSESRRRIQNEGYKPKYTDEELLAIAEAGTVADERFHVRFMEAAYLNDRSSPNAPLSGKLGMVMEGESGKGAKYWSTTFDQIEDADTDPRIISEKLGLPYDPKKKFVLMVVDTRLAAPLTGVKSVSATFENVARFANIELPKDFPPEFTKKVMTPEFQTHYAQHYYAAVERGDLPNAWSRDKDSFEKYLEATDLSPVDKKDLLQRMKMHDKIGNSQDYVGNGVTQSLRSDDMNAFGAVETLNFERREVSVAQLSDENAIAIVKGLELS